MKKYKLTDQFIEVNDSKLFQIQALCNFGNVKKGEIGGFIQSESNLSHEGNCWIFENAKVSGNALVYGNARIYGNAWIYGYARISENARISGNAEISENAKISGNALVYGNAWIYGNARISGNVVIFGNAEVYGYAKIYGKVSIYGNASVFGGASISGNQIIRKDSKISNSNEILHILGLRYPITITPQFVHAGCKDFTFEEFENLKLKDCESNWHSKELKLFKSMLKVYIVNRSFKDKSF